MSSTTTTVKTTDYTAEFYQHKNASGFDDWCIAEGIGFQCTLHEEDSQKRLAYMFQRERITVGIQHDVESKRQFKLPDRFVKILNSNKDILQKMFQLQTNFKNCDMSYPPLMIDANSKLEIVNKLALHENRFRRTRKGLLKLYLCDNSELPDGNGLGAFTKAFLFKDHQHIRASLGKNKEGNLCLKLSVPSDDYKWKNHTYNTDDIISLVKMPMLLPPHILMEKRVTKELLQEVRHQYQLEQQGRINGKIKKIPELDNAIFGYATPTLDT